MNPGRHVFAKCPGLFCDEPRATKNCYVYQCDFCGRTYSREKERKGRIFPFPWKGTHLGNPGPMSEQVYNHLQRVLNERMMSGQERPPYAPTSPSLEVMLQWKDDSYIDPDSEEETLSESESAEPTLERKSAEPILERESAEPIPVRELAEELRVMFKKEEELGNSKHHALGTIKRLELMPVVQEYKQTWKAVEENKEAVLLLKKRKDEILEILINQK